MDTTRSKGRDRRGIQSRAALLRAARHLFSDRGFEGTTVGDIAKEASLRKASLFHYFATKEEIYLAVMDEIFSELAAAVGEAALRDGSYLDRLDGLSDSITSFFARYPVAARLLLRAVLEGNRHGPGLSGDRMAGALQILQAAEGFLNAGVEAGEFAHQDARQLLLSIVGLHVTYFAIDAIADPFLGHSITSEEGTKARLHAVRAQIRAMVSKPRSNGAA